MRLDFGDVDFIEDCDRLVKWRDCGSVQQVTCLFVRGRRARSDSAAGRDAFEREMKARELQYGKREGGIRMPRWG